LLSSVFPFLFESELLGLVSQFGGAFEVGVLDGLVLLQLQALGLLFQPGQVGRAGHAPQPDPRPGLVDHVDGLVRLDPSGDVASGEFDGPLEGGVGDLHAVVGLVPVAEALEDVEGLLAGGRVHHDGLEAPLEGAVLLDVLSVLVECGGADALDLSAAECGLEDVGGVDGALGPAGADQRVHLVHEEHDVLGLGDLLHHRLDPLLELPAVLGAGDHGAQVQRHDPPTRTSSRFSPTFISTWAATPSRSRSSPSSRCSVPT